MSSSRLARRRSRAGWRPAADVLAVELLEDVVAHRVVELGQHLGIEVAA
jgi:hypothetical protein